MIPLVLHYEDKPNLTTTSDCFNTLELSLYNSSFKNTYKDLRAKSLKLQRVSFFTQAM